MNFICYLNKNGKLWENTNTLVVQGLIQSSGIIDLRAKHCDSKNAKTDNQWSEESVDYFFSTKLSHDRNFSRKLPEGMFFFSYRNSLRAFSRVDK